MISALLKSVLDRAELDASEIPSNLRSLARLSFYDWIVCGLAGTTEPVAELVKAFSQDEGGRPIASLFGGGKTAPRTAALVNGTVSHALDFDDTHFAHIGHLSVAIYPAALAVGEERGASADDVIDAFLLGAEAAISIGLALGPEHYNRGFHQTATAGAFGACIAAARLYGLDRMQTTAALGLCATRASGLKSQFGTMGKPYNAGLAASNGVEVAKLAKLGFSAPADGLMGPQGFVTTYATNPQPRSYSANQFLFGDIRYKFHACCHGAHAMIEALAPARQRHQLSLDNVRIFRLKTSPRWMNVCNIASPATGLEVKFSYPWLAGMVLDGRPTGSISLYTDALAADDRLRAFAKRVEVIPDGTVGEMQAVCEIVLPHGEVIETSFDLEEPVPLDLLESKLRNKAAEVLGDNGGRVDPILDTQHMLTARDIGSIVRTAAG